MGKSTIVLVTLAALALGLLVGFSLVGKQGGVANVAQSASPTATTPFASGGAPVYRYLSPADVKIVYDEFGRPKPYSVGENYNVGKKGFKSETLTIEIEPDGAVEYKAIMSKGDAIVFDWATKSAAVYFDFHAHDAAFGAEFFTRYAEATSENSSGSIVAPYDGQHGWYWKNPAAETVTITLTVAGFYDKVIEFDLGGG